MKNMMLIITLLIALPTNADALNVKDLMHDHANQVKSVFAANYAPLEWKSKHLGFDLEVEVQKLHGQIDQQDITKVQDYHKLLVHFFNATADYHAAVRFYALEKASLPLQIMHVEDQYVIAYIDRERLSERVFPAQVGDIVVSFDGQPVAAVAGEIELTLPAGNPQTLKSQAATHLTERLAAHGMEVPEGDVVIETFDPVELRPAKSTLTWQHKAEGPALRNENVNALYDSADTGEGGAAIHPIAANILKLGMDSSGIGLNFGEFEFTAPRLTFDMRSVLKQMIGPLDPRPKQTENPHEIGALTSFVPTLGEKITEDNGFFKAYIFANEEGKKIGYIRIPTYQGGARESAEFVAKIEYLQSRTEALVIDQVNNPGGSVPFLYSLLAALTNEPMAVPRHRIAMTQADIIMAQMGLDATAGISNDFMAQVMIGTNADGYPVSLAFVESLREQFSMQIEDWINGQRLSRPVPIAGVSTIAPHPRANYTKPILVLVNEMDFSAGDFFPAILQDNGRAVIMGTRTAGAGGSVNNVSFPNLLGVASLSFTATIAERENQQPLENLGVTPDVEYELTVDDMRNDFAGYKQAILQVVNEML